MQVNGVDIFLPFEDPVGYALDWRYHVARAIAAGSRSDLPLEVRNDRDIKAWVGYIRRQSGRPNKSDQRYRRLEAWHAGSPIKAVLEALLLTEMDYATIGQQLYTAPDDVRIYQAMFFNVRDEQGTLKAPHLLRVRFPVGGRAGGPELPPDAVLREAALTGGSKMVETLLRRLQAGREGAANIDDIVEQELLRRLLGGQMHTRDLIRMRHVGLVAQQVQMKVREQKGENDEWFEEYCKLMRTMAPQMLEAIRTPEQMAEAQAALERRKLAERRIRRTEVQDRGVGAAQQAAGEHMRQHLQQQRADPQMQPPVPNARFANGKK